MNSENSHTEAVTPSDALARAVGSALLARGERVAIVETTAGGLISARLLSVPGASSWFDHGVIAYTSRAKEMYTGVDPELLRTKGAVSVEAVEAMAAGLRDRVGVAWVVAESGIAGPQTGRRSSKPAGFVAIATLGPEFHHAAEYSFNGDRTSVMTQIAEQCLRDLHAAIVGA